MAPILNRLSHVVGGPAGADESAVSVEHPELVVDARQDMDTPSAAPVTGSVVTASDRLVTWLSRPSAYAERPHHVECRETHISWVFLTDQYAYKLKKPVRFDFLDFSTPERRLAACEAEVRLNRRLAPEVYLGVEPITAGSAGGLRVGGTGEPIDWLVKMRRLPDEASLDRLMARGGADDAVVCEIARSLSDFYKQLPPLPLRAAEYRGQVESHVLANREALRAPELQLPLADVARISAAQLRLLRLAPELFESRVCDGRVVEGHGDLRPEHIYLAPHPLVIDCVEFSEELRRVDVLDELCFLAVECAIRERPDIGGRILDWYCQRHADSPARQLVPFYLCYRACVRAKVVGLRELQVHAACDSHPEPASAIKPARDYLALADHYARELGPPLLMVVRGLSGTGKSTVAQALADQLGVSLLRTDSIRRELFGPSAASIGFNQAHYAPEQRSRVYEEMLDRAERLLVNGATVILDGTFLSTRSRAQAASLARRHAALPIIFHCECPVEVARSRVSERFAAGRGDSEIRVEHLDQQRLVDEPDPVGIAAHAIDTVAELPMMLGSILARLSALLGYPSSGT